MIVLITNDDGIGSPGLRVLAATVSECLPDASVWLVAPAQQQSGCSHAMTMRHPLRVAQAAPQTYSVTGTSADCVFLALHHLLPERPAFVFSGINHGGNLGDDLHYSGTTAAATEAVLLGIPALAVSVAVDFNDPHRGEPAWATAGEYVRKVLPQLLRPGTRLCCLNLNVPDLPADRVKGLRVCSLGRRRYIPSVLCRQDGFGAPYHWLSVMHDGFREMHGSDGELIERGYATITPVETDLTAHTQLQQTRELVARAELSTTRSQG